jgi:hypothetical protein
MVKNVNEFGGHHLWWYMQNHPKMGLYLTLEIDHYLWSYPTMFHCSLVE